MNYAGMYVVIAFLVMSGITIWSSELRGQFAFALGAAGLLTFALYMGIFRNRRSEFANVVMVSFALVAFFFARQTDWANQVKFSMLDVSSPGSIVIDPTIMTVVVFGAAFLMAYYGGLLKKYL